MSNPVLLAVDDDPAALQDVERELSDRYSTSYDVVCTRSPGEALATARRLAETGDEVALALAAERLPGTTGGELLGQIRHLHPHAMRALLVPWGAWDDRATAGEISDSMALGRIDYYVLKPAAPPDEVFHQAVSSFLVEWTRARLIAPHTIHVVGESWSGRAYELRNVLQRCALPHSFCLADSSKGRELLAAAGDDTSLPLLVLPNGQVLSDPTNAEIAGVSATEADVEAEEFDVVIVGAGPAGLSAAVYGASEGLRTLVVDEGGVGGQATFSSQIRNYLGFPRGVSGSRLAEQAYEQAWVFGVSFVFMHKATGLRRAGQRLALTLSKDLEVNAGSVILAMGATHRRIGVPELEDLVGSGVFYGGTVSEAPALAGKDAFVVGGANSAGQAALHLARFAGRVTLVVRSGSLDAGMSHYLVREIEAARNVSVRTGTTVVGGGGEGRLERLVLRGGDSGEEEAVAADGLFVMIGARPHTDWLPPELERDGHGFVLTGGDLSDGSWPLERRPFLLETSVPGVLAAGDVRHGAVKRVGSAVGEGSIAIQLVHSLSAADRLATGRPAEAAAP